VNYVEKLPPDERTEAAGIDAFQLGSDLASMLPINEAKPFRAKLGNLGVQVVLVRTVPHKMAYDRTKIYVEAGKPVVFVLENPDIMPHNLVIVTPNAMAEIGLAAEAIALTPDGQARQYVPNSPKVLHPSRLLSPGETQRMSFTAPTAVGDYPFLCTFPGHWRVMNGTLKVVPKLSDIPPSELNPPPTESEGPARAFVRTWTVDDLVNDLNQLDKGRDFAKGKALFRDATCIKCHKVGTEGGQLGPDMGEVFTKLKDKKIQRLDILKSMVHPSEVIDEKFRTVTIETKKGEIVSGMIVFKDAKIIRVLAGPDAKPTEVALNDIEELTESKISMMPEGLLVTLNKEEILDLLAYVVHGMNESNPAFKK